MRLLAVVFLFLAASALAQPRYGLPQDAYAVFSKWMTTSCIGDEAEQWNAALRRYRSELAPAFQRALADGPPESEVAAIRRAADARYRALATVPLSEYRIEGVDASRLARASRQSYVDDQVQRYVTGYRSNAIAGLGIVGGAQARETLGRFAAKRGDPLSVAASEALKTLAR
jgi:hypothetical protein